MYDEIRNKTGLTDGLDPEQAIIDLAASPTLATDIPGYVRAEAERVAGIVRHLQNINTVNFICVSDIHAQPTDTDAKQRYADGIKHCAQGIQLVRSLVPIDFTASLGDFVYGSVGESAETHRDNLMRAMRVMSMISPDFNLQGNHDAHYHVAESYMDRDDLYRYCTRYNSGLAVSPETDGKRGYFYADLPDKRLRVICLNTADLDPETIPTSANRDGHYISAAQLRWLAGLLDTTGMSGWGIVILSHHPLHWGQRYPDVNSPMNIVLGMLEAYVAGTSGSAVTQVEGETITYDFAGKNAATLIGTFHGHTHNLICGEQNGIIRMGTPNACQDRTNEYGSTAYDEKHRELFGEATSYPKIPNSADDTAFVVYTVDLDQQKVSATCYGAGYDRVMSYGDFNYLAVTYDLTGVVSSNSSPNTAEGLAYRTVLTPADGYELHSVTVTMGGVDVTDSYYFEGVITIPQVTGVIAITAVAKYVLPDGAVNLVETSIDADGSVFNGVGYKDNTSFTEKDGDVYGLSEVSGIVSTGFMLFEVGVPLYISGVTIPQNNAVTRIVTDTDYAVPAKGIWYNVSGFEGYFTIAEIGSTGVYKLEFKSNASKYGPYFRICAQGKGENLIITTTDISKT
jgi:hypothetical protein